jgi:hypothetical protein
MDEYQPGPLDTVTLDVICSWGDGPILFVDDSGHCFPVDMTTPIYDSIGRSA